MLGTALGPERKAGKRGEKGEGCPELCVWDGKMTIYTRTVCHCMCLSLHREVPISSVRSVGLIMLQ